MLKRFYVCTVIALLMCGLFVGLFNPVVAHLDTNVLIDNVRSEVDKTMNNWYTYGKDDDTWLFVSYDVETGVKTTDICAISFLSNIAQAYLTTGNSTYLQWLTNAWNSVMYYGINNAYRKIVSFDSGVKGAVAGNIDITSNAEDLYTGNSLEMASLIETSILLYQETSNSTYYDVAVNITNWMINYRTNLTTGLVGRACEPRYTNVISVDHATSAPSYNYWDAITDSRIQAMYYRMYTLTSNTTYKDVVDALWNWLAANWDNVCSRWYPDGTDQQTSTLQIRQLPDTIEHFTYACYNSDDDDWVAHMEDLLNLYQASYLQAGGYYNRGNANVPWMGAELNMLVELYVLTGNSTYLEQCEATWNYYYATYYYNGHLSSGTAAGYPEYMLDNWWDGTFNLRIWQATSNQTYFDMFDTTWDNCMSNFTATYGYYSYINGTTGEPLSTGKTMVIPLNGGFDNILTALLSENFSDYAGYYIPKSDWKVVYSFDSSIVNPENITYNVGNVDYLVTIDGNDTAQSFPSYQIQCYHSENMSAVYGSNFTSSSGVLFGLSSGSYVVGVSVSGGYGGSDYDEVMFSVDVADTYSLDVSIDTPVGGVYDYSDIAYSFSYDGNDTNLAYSWNVRMLDDTWLYESNQTSASGFLHIDDGESGVLGVVLAGDNCYDYAEVSIVVLFDYVVPTSVSDWMTFTLLSILTICCTALLALRGMPILNFVFGALTLAISIYTASTGLIIGGWLQALAAVIAVLTMIVGAFRWHGDM